MRPALRNPQKYGIFHVNFRVESRAGVQRLCIFTRNCVLVWCVHVFLRRSTRSCRASAHFHSKLRPRLERFATHLAYAAKKCAASLRESKPRFFQNGTGKPQSVSRVFSPATCSTGSSTSVDRRCWLPQSPFCPHENACSHDVPRGRSVMPLNNIICCSCNILENKLFCARLTTSSLETRLMKECGMRKVCAGKPIVFP